MKPLRLTSSITRAGGKALSPGYYERYAMSQERGTQGSRMTAYVCPLNHHSATGEHFVRVDLLIGLLNRGHDYRVRCPVFRNVRAVLQTQPNTKVRISASGVALHPDAKGEGRINVPVDWDVFRFYVLDGVAGVASWK